jgi:2-polyprenyl-3-methyl-5-hydroxy-6-metoxy-1,4-benzoquinol methylase
MMHNIPPAEVVNRESFIMERVKGKKVLDIGCNGPLGAAIESAAVAYLGIDKDVENSANKIGIDIDRAKYLPKYEPDLIIAGEVIEHLSNPGHFLDMLHAYRAPIILTTPNAFCSVGHYWAGRGVENVNAEHVAYYSWHTLKTLVSRHNYAIMEWYWYKGKPNTAEGLIFCLEGESA